MKILYFIKLKMSLTIISILILGTQNYDKYVHLRINKMCLYKHDPTYIMLPYQS